MRSIAQRLALTATATLVLALAGSQPAGAEDIDLYTGLQQNAGKPNVLVIFDDGANSDAAASFTCNATGLTVANPKKSSGAEQCALYGAIQSINSTSPLLGNLNLGLMMFDPKSPGGVFRFPSASSPSAQTLQLMDATGVNSFLSYMQNQFPNDLNGNNVQTAGAMQEAWSFYYGYNSQLKKMVGLSGNSYTSPVKDTCQRNFIIYIGNATTSGHPAESDTQMYNALAAAAPTPSKDQLTQIVYPGNTKYASNWGDEWARFMNQTDLQGTANSANPQNVRTYTITVTDGNNQGYVDFDASMASNGGGKAYVVKLGDVQGLQDALASILNEIQAVNSVFASVSMPAAVNTQGQFLNQVYIGMFRPDATAAPRWMGNLKQYQVGYDSSGNFTLLDSLSKDALSSSGTGFIAPTAVSFWTQEPPLTFGSSGYGSTGVTGWPSGGFWQKSPSGTGWKLDSPDGQIVEKGGAGEMLRAQILTDQSSRTLYTCNGVGKCPTASAMPSFDTSNTWLTGSSGQSAMNSGTSGAPSITTTQQQNYLINWVRGRDVYALDGGATTGAGQEAETGPGGSVTVRGSVHGDVLHSRPVLVNYGGSIGVVAFYGANDGVFRAVNANQTGGITAGTNVVRPGGELWGFIAPEFIGKLSRLYANSPEVQLSTTPPGITPTPAPRDDFFDGSTTVMQDQRNPGNPRTIIYLTARRGGSLIYALDVTDPVNPRYLWSRSNSDIPELGQTWSKPRLMRVAGYANPVLIMGAGYDASSEDSDPASGSDTMGRGIVVLDTYTGAPVWSALANCNGVAGVCVKNTSLTRSIASDVTVVDRTGSGYIQMAYVGDLGGNMWRVDFQTAAGNAPANWTLTLLATLGGAANTNNARKFFYAPDVVPTSGYNAILVGSGDREHPLYSSSGTPGTAYNVVNRFYMLKDPNIGSMASGWVPLTEANLFDATSTAYNGSGSGFFITLPNAGEKVVNAPLTVAGYAYFGTNTPPVPATGQCYPNLGIARAYAVNFLTGAGQNPNRSIVLDGGGFPPSAVYGVMLVGNGNGGTTPTPVCFGCANQANSSTSQNQYNPIIIKPSGLGKRKRTFWYSLTDK
ncbi:pilus assembly protein [Ralstonia sp. UBA689]|uniref:pilus assembly protein n=1 Tax=Ralstonia sp. UBA689 TaxID=1947373 RepID=UPI0025E16D7F|nr:PilC/PilY family type IV pilus protein [Ralstonia sp. UBA689]